MSPNMESDQKPKPKFKACLAIQKNQSPTKHTQALASSALNDSEVLEETLEAVHVEINNNHGGGGDNDNNNSDSITVYNGGNRGGGGGGLDQEEEDRKYFASLPPGYKFTPTDEELVVCYLMKKVANEVLPRNKIRDVKLYQHNPGTLAEEYSFTPSEKEWFFFTPRHRKYKNGNRPNRAAGDGYWKATGADKPIKYKGEVVGYRKALVFYKGKPPKGDKTKWIMHEFRVQSEAPKTRKGSDDMSLDKWVLCRIYQKSKQAKGRRDGNEDSGNEDPKTPSSTSPVAPDTPFGSSANAVPDMALINYTAIGGSNGFMAPPFGNNYAQMHPASQYSALVPAEAPQYFNNGPLNPNYAKFNTHHHHHHHQSLTDYVSPISCGNPLALPPIPAENMHYMKEAATWDSKSEDHYNSTNYYEVFDYSSQPYKFAMDYGGSDHMLHDDGSYSPTQDPNLSRDASFNLPPGPNDPSSYLPKKKDDPSSF